VISQLLYLISLFVPFALGILFASRLRRIDSRIVESLTALTFYILIATIGFRIGSTENLLEQLEKLGIVSLCFAVFTVLGTLIALILLYLPLGAKKTKTKAAARHRSFRALLRGLRDPLFLVIVLGAGILLGIALKALTHSTAEWLIRILLYVLLFFIGISFAQKKIPLKQILSRPDLLLVPFGTAVGSLAGGYFAALALVHVIPLTWGKGMAVAAGFGWYSLSGIILTDLDGPFLGTVALLSNMLRETIALVLVPLVARCPLPNIAIGMGGATSMDVTLPVIERSLGAESAPVALISGALLSAAVPLLVPLLYRLG
jgi:uncharacterized membrane protein YbjE (DUF340 family)